MYYKTENDAALQFNANNVKSNGGITLMNQNSTITNKYVLATDSDFIGTTNGSFKYIGADKYVEVPHVIKGVPVTSYESMFTYTSVEGVKSTNKNVTDMRWMFFDSRATALDLSNFDTSNVTTMAGMFVGNKAVTLDLSNFNTSKVTNMNQMFVNSQVTKLDLSSFNTSKVTDMSAMFEGSSLTELDLSSFDTSNVTDMRFMFSRSQITELDLSSFNTSNATNINYMFADSLTAIGYARTQVDANNFNVSSDKPMELMFIVK